MLTQRDLRAFSEFLADLYAIRNHSALTTYIPAALLTLFRADIATYLEADPMTNQVKMGRRAPLPLTEEKIQLLSKYYGRHPVVQYQRSTNDTQRALKLSDFVSRAQWHRLETYHECYRLDGIEHQLGMSVTATPSRTVTLVVHRSGRTDFSERDRLLLELLRPHVTQTLRFAESISQKNVESSPSQAVPSIAQLEIVEATEAGTIRWATGRARQWLACYFGDTGRSAAALPESLDWWCRHQRALFKDLARSSASQAPLVIARENRRLVVWYRHETIKCFLFLEERIFPDLLPSLKRIGLTTREAQVLALVVQGKTNPAIGQILRISPITVRTHLERVFDKLGVENRTAAVTRVFEFLQRHPP